MGDIQTRVKRSSEHTKYLFKNVVGKNTVHGVLFFRRNGQAGVRIEGLIMMAFSRMPYTLQSFFCYLLSPVCWLSFTLPSKVLKLVGLPVLAKKFPFYFGGHPFSLSQDLKDRLMSPINHRFTKKNLQQILISNNFTLFDVVRTSAGLYVYAEKS